MLVPVPESGIVNMFVLSTPFQKIKLQQTRITYDLMVKIRPEAINRFVINKKLTILTEIVLVIRQRICLVFAFV